MIISTALFLCVGLYCLTFREADFYGPALVLLHIWLAAALVVSYRRERDVLNPLGLILIIGLVRFTVPGLVLFFNGGGGVPFFDFLGIQPLDWLLGLVLGASGLLAFALGWFTVPAPLHVPEGVRQGVSSRTAGPAALVMLAGALCLVVFVSSNASLTSTVVEGTFRGAEVQRGTGKYFYLGLVMISGSVILTAYLLQNNKRLPWKGLWPVFIAMLLYIVLGGRGRAATPILIGLVMCLYVAGDPRGSFKVWVSLAALILVMTWMAYMVALYRGGLGVEALGESFSFKGLWNYITFSLLVDVGHLHSMAAATMVGPGVLEGRTFYGLLGPMNKILLLPEKSSGVYMVQVLAGMGDRRWGLHATLIGDAYVNFGVPGVAAVMAFFGFLVRIAYTSFRHGYLHCALYAIMLVYALRIVFESIEKWGEFCIVLAVAAGLLALGKLTEQRYEIAEARA